MQVLARWSWGLPESRQGKVRRGLVKALFVVVILWAGYGLIAGDAGLLRILSLERRTAELSAEVTAYEAETRELQKRRDLMLAEPEYFEKVTREDYGFAREGEIVYRFDGTSAQSGSLTALFPDSLREKMVKAAQKGAGRKAAGADPKVAGDGLGTAGAATAAPPSRPDDADADGTPVPGPTR